MGNSREQLKRLYGQRERIAKEVNLAEMIRGSLLKRYLECIRPNCRCHKSVKHRHGPYYFLSIRRKDKSYHVYVPKSILKKVKGWVTNYSRTWKGIEDITDINVKLIRQENQRS